MKSVILIGAGCSRENAEMLGGLGIPVLTTWQGIDLLPEDSPHFCGRPGVIGQRAANIIQQKAERLYIFGARLDGSQVNYSLENFAPRAKKIVYDVDPAELEKYPGDWETHQADLRKPFEFVLEPDEPDDGWMKWCKALYNRFRYELDGPDSIEDFVDPYTFVRHLSDVCQEGEVIVPASSGMQSCALMQAFKVKRGQRILLCNTIGAMGFEPMAIGAAIATGKRVIVVCGDGGFFVNVQELEVVRRMGLNIKYFVFDNQGYGSITTMQDSRFNLRVASDAHSGFTLPDLRRFAAVWDFDYFELDNNSDLKELGMIIDSPAASIIRVNTTLAFRYACKVQAALQGNVFVDDQMEDMTPKIPDLERIMRE